MYIHLIIYILKKLSVDFRRRLFAENSGVYPDKLIAIGLQHSHCLLEEAGRLEGWKGLDLRPGVPDASNAGTHGVLISAPEVPLNDDDRPSRLTRSGLIYVASTRQRTTYSNFLHHIHLPPPAVHQQSSRPCIMFAVSPQPYTFSYTPQKSSPLSPCNPNARQRSFPLSPPMSPSPSQKQNTPSLTRRTVKPNPLLLQQKDCGRARRRDLFLRKVRQDGEERKWEARGDQVRRYVLLV